MTNQEKFVEVFDIEPDTEFGIINCPQDHTGSQCPYYEELDGGCHCETWWNEEYKEKTSGKVIDPNDMTHMFDGVTEIPKDAFKGWTIEELLKQIRTKMGGIKNES